MRMFIKMVWVVSALVLVGCGGGSGPTSSSDTLAYQGKTQKAVLTEENTKYFLDLLSNFSQSIDTPSYFKSQKITIANKLTPRLGKSIAKNNKVIGKETIDGEIGGSYTVVAEETGTYTGKFTYTYNNYSDIEGELYNGTVVNYLTVNDQEIITKNTEEYQLFNVKIGSEDITLDGSITRTIEDTGIKLVENYVVQNNKTAQMLKYDKYQTLLNTHGQAVSFSGKVYDSNYGYVDVSTLAPLAYNANGSRRAEGEVLIEGESSSTTVKYAYDNRVRVEIDADKDGTVDAVQVYKEGDYTTQLPNAAPVITITFPESIYTDTDMSAVNVNIYDPDLDGVTTEYEWSINDEAQANGLTLDNALFAKHDILKLTVNATDDRVGDVKSNSQTREQEVLNSVPIAMIESNLTSDDIDAFAEVDFNASSSTDKDGDPLSYEWQVYRYIDSDKAFFDNDPSWELIELDQYVSLYKVNPEIYLNQSTLVDPIFLASSAGKYTIKCIVSDDENASSESQEVNLTVKSAISSIEEANLTDNDEYVSTEYVIHRDLDHNGLEDIIYTSDTFDGTFLNVSYQNTNRVFESEQVDITPSKIDDGTYQQYFSGDFDGNSKNMMLVSTEQADVVDGQLVRENQLQFITLEKGDLRAVKDINIPDISIAIIADTNGDSKDDIVAYDFNISKYVIYQDINNMDKRVVINEDLPYTSNGAIQAVVDINNDGLKDIIFKPTIRKVYNDDDTEYSSYVGINSLIQTSLNTYEQKYNESVIVDKIETSTFISTSIYAVSMLDDTHLAMSITDDIGNRLYTFKLEENALIPIDKIMLNGSYVDRFFALDMNKDGKNDLISFGTGGNILNVSIQKENYNFYGNVPFFIDAYNQLTDRFGINAVVGDIDKDGKNEIMLINGIGKFSYINIR